MRIEAIVHTPGCAPEDLRLEAMDLPPPAAGEVSIAVAYAGVNRPDLLQREGLYPPPSDACPRLGLEVSGTVVALGEGVPTDALGQQVCALTPGGGYATAVNAPWAHCMRIPQGLSMAEAACLPEALLTIWCHGVQRGGLSPTDRCLVVGGASGLGHWLLQLLRAWGNPVRDATASTPDKQAFCIALGATAALPHGGPFNKGHYDFVWDVAGGDATAERLLALAPEGRLVLVGLMAGAQTQLPLGRVLSHRLQILGATLRALPNSTKADACRALEAEVWPLLTSGAMAVHLHSEWPLAQAGQAHRQISLAAHMGKTVLRVSEGPGEPGPK